MALQKNGY